MVTKSPVLIRFVRLQLVCGNGEKNDLLNIRENVKVCKTVTELKHMLSLKLVLCVLWCFCLWPKSGKQERTAHVPSFLPKVAVRFL